MYLEEIGRAPLLTADEEVTLARAIEAGHDALAEIDGASATRRAELRRVVTAAERARTRFLESNLRLVVSIAKRYRRASAGIDLLDLIQEGNLGLVRAVEKFDWRKGFKFSTYATWWIRQAITRALLEKGRMIRVPSRVHDALVVLGRAEVDFQAEHGRAPTPGELAERSGIDLEIVIEATAFADVASLETPVGEDGATLGTFIHMEGEEGPEDVAVLAEISVELRQAIGRLDERERFIVSSRFGLSEGHPMTRVEIGERLRLTPERIGQIEKRALSRLRHPSFGLMEGDFL